MKVEKLIEELKKLPSGTEVCIVDWKKNLHYADGELQGIGIAPNFEVSYETENVSEPFAALSFENDDYDDA